MAEPQRAREKLRIWIDTDVALGYHESRPKDVDDAFCIIDAIANPRVELVGITPVFGNAPVAVCTEISNELVRMMGSSVEVTRGASTAGEVAVEAADAMAKALRKGPLRILAIGPLTNVASLIERHPDVVANIQEVVVVAGRSPGQVFEVHGASGIPDFNFECDVDAFRILMQSDVPVAFTGFELTSQVVLTRDDLEQLRGRSRVADHLVTGAMPWLEWFCGVFPKAGGFHPWDSAALSYLLHPEFFVHEQRGWRILDQPDASHWIELGTELPGKRSVYCTGFAPDGQANFIRSVLAAIP